MTERDPKWDLVDDEDEVEEEEMEEGDVEEEGEGGEVELAQPPEPAEAPAPAEVPSEGEGEVEGDVDVKEGDVEVEEGDVEEGGEEEGDGGDEKEEVEEKEVKAGEEKKEAPEGPKKSVFGLDENIAGALAYLGTVITGILFLLLEKENRFVRFHAMQSIVIFLPAMIIIKVLDWFFYNLCLASLIILMLDLLLIIVWIVGMWKAYEGEYFKFPVAGDVAEKLLKDLNI